MNLASMIFPSSSFEVLHLYYTEITEDKISTYSDDIEKPGTPLKAHYLFSIGEAFGGVAGELTAAACTRIRVLSSDFHSKPTKPPPIP